MKVLMTADTIGGVWCYALELADALRRHDVEVVLATQGAWLRPEQRRAAARRANIRLEESAFRLEWMAEPWHDIRRGDDWLLALEARHAPDIVHLNDLTRGALRWRAPALVVGHSCVLSWWQAVRREAAPPAWAEYRRRVAGSLAAADLVVAPSAAMLAALRAHYGAFHGIVIHNGRDMNRFRSGEKEPFVLAAGRVWDDGKNLAALGRIAHTLSWPVFVAGDAAHPDGGTSGCGRACLIGRLAEDALARWYAAATLYALPARYEPFGLSALEAALSGCALVLGDIPSLRELWHDAAVFADPFDDDALAAALRRIIDDHQRRRDLVRNARARALSLSARAMANRYIVEYGRLLRQRREREEVVLCAS